MMLATSGVSPLLPPPGSHVTTDDVVDGDQEDGAEYVTELEFEVATPRMNTPYFQALRNKYPRAFVRRTSMSSNFSETASVASLSSELSYGVGSVRSCVATPRLRPLRPVVTRNWAPATPSSPQPHSTAPPTPATPGSSAAQDENMVVHNTGVGGGVSCGLPPKPPVRGGRLKAGSVSEAEAEGSGSVVGSTRKLRCLRVPESMYTSGGIDHDNLNSDNVIGDYSNMQNGSSLKPNSELNGSNENLLESDLNKSFDSFGDPLEENSQHCDTGVHTWTESEFGGLRSLRRSEFASSMSSLLSEQVTPAFRKNCRLVKRPIHASTLSLKDEFVAFASKTVVDVNIDGRNSESSQRLRNKLNNNRDAFRKLLSREHLPFHRKGFSRSRRRPDVAEDVRDSHCSKSRDFTRQEQRSYETAIEAVRHPSHNSVTGASKDQATYQTEDKVTDLDSIDLKEMGPNFDSLGVGKTLVSSSVTGKLTKMKSSSKSASQSKSIALFENCSAISAFDQRHSETVANPLLEKARKVDANETTLVKETKYSLDTDSAVEIDSVSAYSSSSTSDKSHSHSLPPASKTKPKIATHQNIEKPSNYNGTSKVCVEGLKKDISRMSSVQSESQRKESVTEPSHDVNLPEEDKLQQPISEVQSVIHTEPESKQDKDSDVYSGIIARLPKQTSRETSEEENNSQPTSSAASGGSRLRKLRSRQHSRQNAPIRADHNLHSLISPRGDSSETESTASCASVTAAVARLAVRPRSASADARTGSSAGGSQSPRARVIFQDEVGGDIVKIHRAESHPALSTALPFSSAKVVEPASGNLTISGTKKESQCDSSLHTGHRPFHSDQNLAIMNIKSEDNIVKKTVNRDIDRFVSAYSSDTNADVNLKLAEQNAALNLAVNSALPPKPVTERGRTRHKPHSKQQSGDCESELATEVAQYTSVMESLTDAAAAAGKKSRRLPWRRSKGRYTPSEELDKVQHASATNLARAASWSSVFTASSHKHSDKPSPDAKSVQSFNTSGSNCPKETKQSPIREQSQVPNQIEAGNVTTPTRPPRHKKEGKGNKARSSIVEQAVYMENQYEELHIKDEAEGQGSPGQLSPETPSTRHADTNFVDDEPEAVYASVQKSVRQCSAKPEPGRVSSLDAEESGGEEANITPPLPYRGYHERDSPDDGQSLGAESRSLMGSLRDSARRKFGKLRKALSVEKLSKKGTEDSSDNREVSKAGDKKGSVGSGGFFKLRKSSSLRGLFGKKESAGTYEISDPITTVETPKNFRQLGQIKSVGSDGSRVVQLQKPTHGPWGFYLARGGPASKQGIFVSRLSDGIPQHFFSGLLSVGDEVVEINKTPVKNLDMDKVYDLLNEKEKAELVILPPVS